MKVTEFSEATKVDYVPAPWENELGPDDFVSYLPSYVGGAYRGLFEKCSFPSEAVGDITYYLYDPVKNGAPEDGKYPLLVFLHGATNALDGVLCITHCGGELYASPSYQQSMGGGAYILIPLANERRDEEGNLADSWSECYLAPLKGIIDRIKQQNSAVGKTVVLGGSSGGYMSWLMAERYPDTFDGCVPISSGYVPDEEALSRLERTNMKLLVMHGRHDELADFNECIHGQEDKLLSMKNCMCYFPEWVRNGDHGVASLNFGFEMGQHCLINQVQANLMYVDGTPYDERLPEGITGWIRQL